MNLYTLQHVFSSDNTFERLEISVTEFNLIRSYHSSPEFSIKNP